MTNESKTQAPVELPVGRSREARAAAEAEVTANGKTEGDRGLRGGRPSVLVILFGAWTVICAVGTVVLVVAAGRQSPDDIVYVSPGAVFAVCVVLWLLGLAVGAVLAAAAWAVRAIVRMLRPLRRGDGPGEGRAARPPVVARPRVSPPVSGGFPLETRPGSCDD